MKIGYLGPVNSYSFVAAEKLRKQNDSIVPFSDFQSLFDGLNAECDLIVVPIENSIEGSVNICVDLLLECDTYIRKEIIMPIRHALIGFCEITPSNVTKIITHPQAYSQCRRYLKKNYPNCEIILVSSTTKALEKLDDNSLAIAGSHAIRSGLHILDADIQDYKNNSTRFLAVSRADKDITLCEYPEKITVVFEAEDRPGGLLDVLEIFSQHNLNMTKIESRPSKKRLGNYIFYVDFIGCLDNIDVMNALDKIKRNTAFLRVLGNY